MKEKTSFAVLTVFVVALLLALGFGVTCVLAKLVVWCAGLFGYVLPFWPTVAALYVTALIVRAFSK